MIGPDQTEIEYRSDRPRLDTRTGTHRCNTKKQLAPFVGDRTPNCQKHMCYSVIWSRPLSPFPRTVATSSIHHLAAHDATLCRQAI